MTGFRFQDLNPEQQAAVRCTEGPLLILAGAGTGKTRVITARIVWLVSQKIDPARILAVTFTNKAAAEMRERLMGMLREEEAKKTVVSTFHALCMRILRQEIERLGYKRNFSIYDEGDQTGLLKKIINRIAAKDETLEVATAKSLISKAKNNGWNPPEDDRTLIGSVYRHYQAELKTLNAVDFDDLLLLAVRLLREHPDAAEKWRSKFDYIMVDEFQDTNRLQLEMVTLLADARRNVAVVGDDDQSIYGWRGAEVSNILEFEAHFPNPTVVKLEQNYRSTNAILRTANSLIKNNPRRRAKQLWSAEGDGEKVRVLAMQDDREEAQFIANEIHRLRQAQKAVWPDFAVLFRTNMQSRLIEQNLRSLKVPYHVIGGKSFFDRREVKDVLAYASTLLNPADDVSLLRIINTPARGISAATVEKATEWSAQKRCSVFEALRNSEFLDTVATRTRTSIEAFTTFIDAHETAIAQPLADQAALFTKMIEETGYRDDLRRSCKTPEEALGREENLNQLFESLRIAAEKKGDGLRGFLDHMMLRQDREEDDDDAEKAGDAVTLITLHAAKGLEYPRVYLIGLEEGILPHDRSKLEGTVDEERRLLYVGITRARKMLTLTHCKTRVRYGSPEPRNPSSFLKELAPEWLERGTAREIVERPLDENAVQDRFAALRAALAAAGNS